MIDIDDTVDPPVDPMRAPIGPEPDEATVSALLRRLSGDARLLIQEEVALAKAEALESARSLARNGVLIGGGAFLLALGGAVLVIFLILGVGRLLGGEYWLSTLIIGVLLAAAGGTLFLAGRRGLRRGALVPQRTVETLVENKRWAESHARQIKQELTP